MRIGKGEYGYFRSQKIRRSVVTAVMFAIPAVIFVTGLIITKSRLNMFTFVAIMGCLPASRSATGMIMMLMQKPASEQLRQKAEQAQGNAILLYDMAFTAYQKTVPVDCMAVGDTQAIGYCSNAKADLAFGEQHIREILKKNGCKSTGVKLYAEEKPFLEQTRMIGQREQNGKKAEYICDVLRAIAL